MRKFLKYNRWAILWGFFIILLLSLPGKVFPKLPGFLDLLKPDKLVHLFIFGVYVLLQIRGLTKQDTFPALRKHAVIISLTIGIILGAGTELLQRYWIPLRIGSIYDLIADMAGCLLGVLLVWKLKIKN